MADPATVVAGLLLLGLGLVGPPLRATAATGEVIDAVGSTTAPDEVEPTWWNLLLTRLVGFLLVVLGIGVLQAGP